MSEYKRPPISEETKEILDKRKPDGISYDYYIRHAVLNAPPLAEGGD